MTKPPRRILVVDDSESCLRVCRLALEKAGHTVIEARSVPEALLALRQKEMPEALVCDLLLGTLGTGFDVVVAAKASMAGMFCVAVTGLVGPDLHGNALEAGFDAFLPKPFVQSRLVELLP